MVKYYEGSFTRQSRQRTLRNSHFKSIRDPSAEGETLQCPTPFEKALNVQMVKDKDYSLNRRKNWEKVDEIMKSVEADDRCIVLPGKEFQNQRPSEAVTCKLGYFDLDEMKEETMRQKRAQKKYDQSLDYNVNDLNNYIRDRFYDTILRKESHYRRKHWKRIQMVKPKNISKEAAFIAAKLITARSIKAGCRIHSASVRRFGIRSFWSPRKWDDPRDFIQLDLGKNCLLEAISTRGRVLKRDRDCEIDLEKSDVEYVKKYKVYIRKDDGQNVQKRSEHHRDRNGTEHVHDDVLWTPLGAFSGNKDSESEVANPLKLPNSNKPGVVCRYIRVFPMSYAEGGFHGRKSMRIGVYGDAKYEEKNNDKSGNGKDGASLEEEKMQSTSGNGELIHNKNVPAVIITIQKPSEYHNRNCWGVNGFAKGAYSSGRYTNKTDKHNERKARRNQRSQFKAKALKFRHVKDYGGGHDSIDL